METTEQMGLGSQYMYYICIYMYLNDKTILKKQRLITTKVRTVVIHQEERGLLLGQGT